MVSVASLFAQVLSLISRRDFSSAVRRRDAEKAAKGFSCWDQFVAMLKSDAVWRIVEIRPVPSGGNILTDELIELDSIKGRSQCPHTLRRVVVWDEVNGRPIVLVTNHLGFAAGTIGRIYKERWQIELYQSYRAPCHTFYHMEVLGLGLVRAAT